MVGTDRTDVRTERVRPLRRDEVRAAARVVARAFRTEGLTTYAYDLSTDRRVERYARVVEAWLVALFRSEPLLVAEVNGRPVGLASVGFPRGQGGVPWVRALAVALSRLPGLVPMVAQLRWRRGWRLMPAMRPPKGLPRRQYTLRILAVAPEYQGRGLGRRLLDAVHTMVDGDAGADGIYLVTEGETNRAIYQRFGYEIVAEKRAGDIVVLHMYRRRGAGGSSGGEGG